jgi:hypothetical protein
MEQFNYVVTVRDTFGFTICRGQHYDPMKPRPSHKEEAFREAIRRLDAHYQKESSLYATTEAIIEAAEVIDIATDNPGFRIEGLSGLQVKAVRIEE